jgi:hypothetical protein
VPDEGAKKVESEQESLKAGQRDKYLKPFRPELLRRGASWGDARNKLKLQERDALRCDNLIDDMGIDYRPVLLTPCRCVIYCGASAALPSSLRL